ncbi:MAG: sodium-dependent transporter [Acidobacteriota bacterium]|nr:sodium-dependent transporter [Acidobacteriota bacterium]
MASRGKWSSQLGFILAAAGSAIGIGNIWRFPYMTGKYGGAVFLFVYLAAVVLLGLPVLIAEIAIGRATGKNPVGAFAELRPKSQWKLVGYMGVLAGMMILSYYSLISGWTLGYFFKTLAGSLKGATTSATPLIFDTFVRNFWLQAFLLAAFIFITGYIVSKGIAGGIEKACKVLMPVLVVIMLILLGRALTLPGAGKGLEFYLRPDFSKLSPRMIIDAMGQAFFSLSLGMGAMITYGSYLKKDESIPAGAAWVAALDTVTAVMAGFIIFPALAAFGMNPAGGHPLVFHILPVIFDQMPLGSIFGMLFFLLLGVAALASTVSLLEVVVAYCIDELKWSRGRSVLAAGSLSFLIGIPSVLSFGGVKFFQKLPLLNISFFEMMDFVWSTLALSVGALFICIFAGYVWKSAAALKEIGRGAEKFRHGWLWTISVKYLCPALILLTLFTLAIR